MPARICLTAALILFFPLASLACGEQAVFLMLGLAILASICAVIAKGILGRFLIPALRKKSVGWLFLTTFIELLLLVFSVILWLKVDANETVMWTASVLTYSLPALSPNLFLVTERDSPTWGPKSGARRVAVAWLMALVMPSLLTGFVFFLEWF